MRNNTKVSTKSGMTVDEYEDNALNIIDKGDEDDGEMLQCLIDGCEVEHDSGSADKLREFIDVAIGWEMVRRRT